MAEPILQDKTVYKTRVLPVKTTNFGQFADPSTLENWQLPSDNELLAPLREAALHLRTSDIPVGFPTETVYGLGADATRSGAVKGIYKAKGRPSDNPLITHICDLAMLRSLLAPAGAGGPEAHGEIPEIYKPLIKRFWPGPLTILLPNPSPSKLAPEVTAGLPSFGVRMPSSPLARSLIHLVGAPLAAPSANASTKPSPTSAAHVLHDLDGRIEVILDGGPCSVGVESTVVDGLCDPPVVLRPGGVSIDLIRECEGWEDVVRGYKDASEVGSAAPRAPGMKYKHYSPKAEVVLYEATASRADKLEDGKSPAMTPWGMLAAMKPVPTEIDSGTSVPVIGIVSTKHWDDWAGGVVSQATNQRGQLDIETKDGSESTTTNIVHISLGQDTKAIARGLFSALRDLDLKGADVIYVEGIEDEGDIAAAVMNRLRKAATTIEK